MILIFNIINSEKSKSQLLFCFQVFVDLNNILIYFVFVFFVAFVRFFSVKQISLSYMNHTI